jgi:LuxR family maltose regulon positive regulatory protein
VEALSAREQVVLEWLPSPLTLKTIAGELFISLDTMKSHARHIYRKIGVSGRDQAVECARSLNLLQTDAVA